MIYPMIDVADVEASVRFYTEKLNFTHDGNITGPDGTTVFGGVRLGGNGMGIGKAEVDGKPGAGVLLTFYLPDDMDIDTYYQQIQANGVEIARPIQDEYWGDRMFTLFDPDGYRLGFAKTVRTVSMEEMTAAAKQQ